MPIRRLAPALPLLLVALIALACAPAAPSPGAAPSQDVRGEREAIVQADNFDFDPPALRGQPGQKLRIRIRNLSGTEHNFSIPEQQIDEDIPPNGQAEVEVTFPESGSVQFTCEYHKAQGMNGHLVVGDVAPSAPGGGQSPDGGMPGY